VTPDSCGVHAFRFNQSYSPNLMKLMSVLGGKTKVSERVWLHNGTAPASESTVMDDEPTAQRWRTDMYVHFMLRLTVLRTH
jgi:hypothetical protein